MGVLIRYAKSAGNVEMTDEGKALEFIAKCNEPDKLRVMIKNAQDRGALNVTNAGFRKLISILPSEKPGTVEHDFWQTIHAFEHILSEER